MGDVDCYNLANCPVHTGNFSESPLNCDCSECVRDIRKDDWQRRDNKIEVAIQNYVSSENAKDLIKSMSILVILLVALYLLSKFIV